MTAVSDLDHRIADYARPMHRRGPLPGCSSRPSGPTELTRQRRGFVRAPWRFQIMNSYAKVGVQAVIAIGAVGWRCCAGHVAHRWRARLASPRTGELIPALLCPSVRRRQASRCQSDRGGVTATTGGPPDPPPGQSSAT